MLWDIELNLFTINCSLRKTESISTLFLKFGYAYFVSQFRLALPLFFLDQDLIYFGPINPYIVRFDDETFQSSMLSFRPNLLYLC